MRKHVCTLSTRLSGEGNERTLPNQGLDIAVEKKIPGMR